MHIQESTDKDKAQLCSALDSNRQPQCPSGRTHILDHVASYPTEISDVSSSKSHIQRIPPSSKTLWNFVIC